MESPLSAVEERSTSYGLLSLSSSSLSSVFSVLSSVDSRSMGSRVVPVVVVPDTVAETELAAVVPARAGSGVTCGKAGLAVCPSMMVQKRKTAVAEGFNMVVICEDWKLRNRVDDTERADHGRMTQKGRN